MTPATSDRAARQAADLLAGALSDALKARGRVSLAVSGGKTPVAAFQALSQAPLDWSRVTVTLVDERWVDPTSGDSNQRLVEETLLQGPARAARLLPMKTDAATPQGAVAEVSQALRTLGRLDAVLLGMGEDGHFASLFPLSPVLARGLHPDADELCVAVPPGPQGAAPVQPRLSLTLAAIARARTLVLLTGGGVKRAVLDRVLAGGCEFSLLPIAALFAARPDTILLHGPK